MIHCIKYIGDVLKCLNTMYQMHFSGEASKQGGCGNCNYYCARRAAFPMGGIGLTMVPGASRF